MMLERVNDFNEDEVRRISDDENEEEKMLRRKSMT